jgi:hypothetical protein
VTADGTKTNDEAATLTIAEEGIVTIKLSGTEFGTFVYSTMAIDGDEAGTITYVLGNDETQDKGTTTGEDHVDGIETTVGVETGTANVHTFSNHVVTETETTADDGTV